MNHRQVLSLVGIASITGVAICFSGPTSSRAADSGASATGEPAGTSKSGTAAPNSSARRILRVGADPDNLPYSNRQLEGFENRLAELIAAELNAELEYVWKPHRRSFVRELLREGAADVVMGLPQQTPKILVSRPYYRSTYCLVCPASVAASLTSLNDPSLSEKTIGVHLVGRSGTPPAHALAARGLTGNMRSYAIYGDAKETNPAGEIVKDVGAGRIDRAVVWGPIAGYFAAQQPAALKVIPLTADKRANDQPFDFAISVGVAPHDSDLRDEIDGVLKRRVKDIDRLLADFHVPCLTLQNQAGSDEVGP